MRHHPNKELHRFPSQRGKGLVGTSIIHILLFLLLIIVGFTVSPQPNTEEGIMVNFGTDETGLGMIEPSPPPGRQEASSPAVQQKTSPPLPSKAAAKTEEDPLLTQNNEEAPEVKKADPEAVKKRLEKIEANRIKREQLEADRIRKEQEETERKRIEGEQQRKTDIMNRTKNALANSKNTGTNSTSEGVAGGAGNQGVISGSINSKVRGEGGGMGDKGKGISYDLQGRGFQALPSPKYDYQEGGKVVVEVSVDRSGKVILAVPGVKGSTILDDYLLKVAKEAALEAHFEAKPDAPVIQKGTITYNFILK